jgi:hypothetical protein
MTPEGNQIDRRWLLMLGIKRAIDNCQRRLKLRLITAQTAPPKSWRLLKPEPKFYSFNAAELTISAPTPPVKSPVKNLVKSPVESPI